MKATKFLAVTALVVGLCAVSLHFFNNAHPPDHRELAALNDRLGRVEREIWSFEGIRWLSIDMFDGWSAVAVEPEEETEAFGPNGWHINVSGSNWLWGIESRYDLHTNGDIVEIITALTAQIDVLNTTTIQLLLDRIEALEEDG